MTVACSSGLPRLLQEYTNSLETIYHGLQQEESLQLKKIAWLQRQKKDNSLALAQIKNALGGQEETKDSR